MIMAEICKWESQGEIALNNGPKNHFNENWV